MSILEPADARETGRRLGHDLFCHRIRIDRQALDPAVEEGWLQAQDRRPPRRAADRFTRKWLQLRLNAHRRRRVVDAAVTPDLLRRIDVSHCPVTREPLSHGALRGSDWSIDRLNNDGAYVPNNLAVMSTAANAAKGDRSYEQVIALAEGDGASSGLLPAEWLRLATLMLGPCFATRPHQVPLIPLAAPIPSHALRPAVQQVQQLFTVETGSAAAKNALIKHMRPTCRSERAEQRLRLLAETMHLRSKGLDHRFDVWLQPGVLQAFVDWRAVLDEPSWALAAEISRRLSGATRVAADGLRSWHLETRGRAA